MKKIKPSSKIKRVLLLSLVLLLFLIGGIVFFIFNTLNKVDTEDFSQSNEDIGIDKTIEDKLEGKENIINIALFGLDSRSNDFVGRSDSIIIVTIDKVRNKIKLSSLMRDSYVSIEGHGKDKLNHSYAFGGAQLAVKTINQNFLLNIKDYITIDFYGLESIIDEMSGVSIDIQQDELEYINYYIKELSDLTNISPNYINTTGTQNLSGLQAVAYTRIRYTSGGDYRRTERQRYILESLLNKAKEAGIVKLPSLINSFLPYVKTSFSSTDLLKLGTTVLTSDINSIQQARFPLDSDSQGGYIEDIWYLQYNSSNTQKAIYNYIFQDINP